MVYGMDCLARLQEKASSLYKENGSLRFCKVTSEQTAKPQDAWNNAIWTDQTKEEMSGHSAQHHI